MKYVRQESAAKRACQYLYLFLSININTIIIVLEESIRIKIIITITPYYHKESGSNILLEVSKLVLLVGTLLDVSEQTWRKDALTRRKSKHEENKFLKREIKLTHLFLDGVGILYI